MGADGSSAIRPFTEFVTNEICCPIGRVEGDIRFRPKNHHSFEFKPGEPIEGTVSFTVYRSTEFFGMWVALGGDAFVISNSTGVKKRFPIFRTPVFILFGTPLDDLYDAWGQPTIRIDPGEHEYTVKTAKLKSSLHLPPSFEDSFGGVEYFWTITGVFRLIKDRLYMFQTGNYIQFKGNVSYESDPKFAKPVTFSRRRSEGSWFSPSSKRNLLSAEVTLNTKAYVPGDSVCGVLKLHNPSGIVLKEMTSSVIQKTAHTKSHMRNVKSRVLVEDRRVVDSEERDVEWEFELTLPTDLMPTCRRLRRFWEIFYIFQFVIKCDAASDLKGEVEIAVGTKSGGESTGTNATCPASSSGGMLHLGPLVKGNSMQSICSSLPPPYSGLSSRRSSMSTLPPPYDSAWDLVSIPEGTQEG